MSLALAMQLVGFNVLTGGVTNAQRGGLNREVEKKMKTLTEKIRGRAAFYVRGKRASNPPDRLGRISGKLAASIAARVKARGGSVTGEIFTQNLVYARIHEFGGTIFPRRKPFLAFEVPEKGSGNWVYAKSVRIPARPYIGRALDDFAGEIKEELGEAFVASVQ